DRAAVFSALPGAAAENRDTAFGRLMRKAAPHDGTSRGSGAAQSAGAAGAQTDRACRRARTRNAGWRNARRQAHPGRDREYARHLARKREQTIGPLAARRHRAIQCRRTSRHPRYGGATRADRIRLIESAEKASKEKRGPPRRQPAEGL